MKTPLPYRSRTIGTLSLLFSMLMLSVAQAATVSYNTGFAFPLSPGNQAVVLPQWDPTLFPGQTLVSVELDILATIGANVTAENDSAIGGNMGVNLTGIANATSSGLSATATVLQGAGPVAVAATDGNPGAGPDFVDFGLLSGNDSDSDTIFAGLGAYIGNGTFPANIAGNGGFSVSGVSDSTIQVSGFGTNGVLTVTYEFVPVPEPASIVLGAFAACGLALVGWRRRGSK
jgi:hypothetical protein